MREPTTAADGIATMAGIKLCECHNRHYGASHGVDYGSVMPTSPPPRMTRSRRSGVD